MPAPAYILFAQNVDKNRKNNMVSLGSVIERLVVNVDNLPEDIREQDDPMLGVEFRGVAVWLREDSDAGKEFESELAFIKPDGTETVKAHSEFKFADDQNLQRFFLKITSIPLLEESGVLQVESRIRRKGNKRWKSQQYPILVDMKNASTNGNGKAEESDE